MLFQDYSIIEMSVSGGDLPLQNFRKSRTAEFIIILILLIISCAKQGFPPGGPEDKTPPEIVRTEPGKGQTGVPPGRDVTVWFSERIRPPTTPNDAIFFSPYPGEGVRFKWSGKKLKIRFPKPFPDSTTIVVTFGTGLRDYPGNAMKSSFSLAFSTGAILDRGTIHGTVYGPASASGLDVWAYLLKNNMEPDPRKMEPDYAVQCQERGGFRFSHLSPGQYRLFAVQDRSRDRRYQPVEDEIGVPFRDITLSSEDQAADSVSFRMTREDTLGPSLVRASALNRNSILFQFDEPITVQDRLSPFMQAELSDSLPIQAAYVDPSDSRQIRIMTAGQKPGKRILFSILGLTDLAGNPPDSSVRQIRVEGSDKPDTTKPRLLSTQPKNNEQGVNLDSPVRLVFNIPLDTVGSRPGIVLSDSSGQSVDCRHQWDTPASLTFIPKSSFASFTVYRIRIGDSAKDFWGRAFQDTAVSFRTLNADTLSEISGTVSDLRSDSPGMLLVSIKQADRPNQEYKRTILRSGPYRFDRVLPGRYILGCFRDRNGNGQYDYGRPFPFEPSERFSVYPDTIVVRPRWPNEGNDLTLP